MPGFTNRFLLVGALVLSAGVVSSQPNVLVIYTDDQRTDDLVAMPQVATRIVAQGVRFERFVATTPMCGPSRASLLRGQYAHNHGIIGHRNWPGDSYERWVSTGLGQQTLGTWMQAAGYRTAYIGKHQVGYPRPDDRAAFDPGWDNWLVPYDRYTRGIYTDVRYAVDGEVRDTGDAYLTDVEGERLAGFVSDALDDGVPFFAVFAPPAPHAARSVVVGGRQMVGPPIPAPRHLGAFAGVPGPRSASYDEQDVSDKPAFIRATPRLWDAEQARIDTVWQRRTESLMAVDEWVGTILDLLAARGALDDTYVVFASDNGFLLGEHRLPPERKTIIPYREATRLPLYIRGPGIPAGGVRASLAATIDLAPTILDWAGASIPALVDGRSLARVAADGDSEDWRSALLVERWDQASTLTYRSLVGDALAFTRWASPDFTELYDHRADPFEVVNIASRLARADRERLGTVLDGLSACAGADCRVADRAALVEPPPGSAFPAGPAVGPPFPNPTAGPVRLAVTPSESDPLSIEVLDALGRRVLAPSSVPRGAEVAEVDLGALAPGVYVVRIRSGASVSVRAIRVAR